MPLLQRGCCIGNNLAIDDHNEVDDISCRCSHLMTLSAWRCHIINPGQFLTDGLPTSRREDRGAVSLKYRPPLTASSPLQRTSPEAGFQVGLYGDSVIAQQNILDVSNDPNEWSHSWAPQQKPINNNQ